MSKDGFMLRADYLKWLVGKGGVKAGASANCYVRMDKEPVNKLPYIEIIANFMCNGELSYAYSVIDFWADQIKNQPAGINSKTAGNIKSYFAKIVEYFTTNETRLMSLGQPLTLNSRQLASLRRMVNKRVVPLAQIDSMDALLNALGHNGFIRLSVESSFFFAPNIVAERFNEVANEWNNGGVLTARKGVNLSAYPEMDIKVDSNNNASVCSLINSKFGYNLNSKLNTKPFLNIIISHIWGGAVDPRMLTALWNIALIPAWANHLMDKPASAGQFINLIQNTFKAICIKHYEMQKFNWANIGMTCPAMPAKGDYLPGTYTVRVIQPVDKAAKAKVGRIIVVNIEI